MKSAKSFTKKLGLFLWLTWSLASAPGLAQDKSPQVTASQLKNGSQSPEGTGTGAIKPMSDAKGDPLEDFQSLTIPKLELSIYSSATSQDDYVIGSNDSLYINIYGLESLGSPVARNGSGPILKGSRVDGKGNIQLPIVGNLKVAGLTLSEARDKILEVFKGYIKDPWVVVELAEYRSQPIYLSGEFNKPGVYYMDRPLSLLQGIALGEGLTEKADLKNARLVRNNNVLPVDLYALVQKGDLNENVVLQKDDTIYFPDNSLQKVFVLGEVEEPGEVIMPHGELSLLQAISAAGGFRQIEFDSKKVAVIRSSSAREGSYLLYNVDRIQKGGMGQGIALQAGDIVFVPKNRFGKWNEVMRQLQPTLNNVQSALAPFASVFFFTRIFTGGF
ncbi:MAG: polysaccharide biosynthesis/export family protein [Candidatus Caenarcaniphilales bacterium]|nr:polysaccharide biosynthesis/export family protein [Candidatus Caenarcaniphilales bacterium]